MVSIAILAVVIALAAALFHPAVANNRTWRAIVTPLASIIGSGFLVIGPLLDYNYGYLAPIVMAGLCLTAYLFGGAIRRNIAELGSGGDALAPSAFLRDGAGVVVRRAILAAFVRHGHVVAGADGHRNVPEHEHDAICRFHPLLWV